MGLFGSKGEKQTSRERNQLREHLRDLGELREEKLRELGALAAEMHGGDGIDREKLWASAAEVAAVEDEAELVHRGLKEKLTLEQLEKLGRGESATAAPEDSDATAPKDPDAGGEDSRT